MENDLKRLVMAAARVLRRPIHAVLRVEWDARLRPGGEPTKLQAPLSPFATVTREAPVETMAMSARPFADPGGFHIVRVDLADTPKVFNTDSYVELDLARSAAWPEVLATSGIKDDVVVEKLLSDHVFLSGPEKRDDHHSAHVPQDIDGAKPK